MRRFKVFSGLVGVLMVSALVSAGEQKTLKGDLVDEKCYTKDHAAKGEDHADCAESCARKGMPVALVTADGQVYTVTGTYAANKNEKLMPFLSKTVELKGEVSEKDGKKTVDASSIVAAK